MAYVCLHLLLLPRESEVYTHSLLKLNLQIFILIANILATFNIEKPIGPDGKPIEPDVKYLELIRCVSLSD